jgi:hypothetical protein
VFTEYVSTWEDNVNVNRTDLHGSVHWIRDELMLVVYEHVTEYSWNR